MRARFAAATLCWLVFAASIVLYAILAMHSPLAGVDRHREAVVATEFARLSGAGQACERRLAALYWQANPDVSESAYFGRAGPLGMLGAREHFDRHGRREGRLWPKAGTHCAPPVRGGEPQHDSGSRQPNKSR